MNSHDVEKNDEMRTEYNLSTLQGKTKGKYVQQYHQETHLVLLDDDVAQAFPDAKSVNDALRLLITVSEKSTSTAHS